jgi:hypothetical protein
MVIDTGIKVWKFTVPFIVQAGTQALGFVTVKDGA